VSTGVTFSGALRRPVWCVARVVGDTQRRPGGREKRGQRSSPARTDRQGAWLRRTTATVPQASSPAARPIARWSGKRRPRSATAVRWKARAQCLRASGPRLASAICAVCPHAVSSAHSTNLWPLAKRLHEYAGWQPAGHPIGSATEAADRACGRTVPAHGGRACLARHAPMSFIDRGGCVCLTPTTHR